MIIKRTIIGIFSGLVGGAVFGTAVGVAICIPLFFDPPGFFFFTISVSRLTLLAAIVGAVIGLLQQLDRRTSNKHYPSIGGKFWRV